MSGYEPRWDIDRPYGEDGETLAANVLGLPAEHLEVKRKRYEDGLFYVELEHDPGGTDDYRPSGLETTKAEYYAYVIGSTGVVVLIPVPLLKEVVERALR